MSNILKEIVSKKKEEIIITKQKYSLSSLIKLLPKKENRNFKKLLKYSQDNKKNNIIGEIKKSSPSLGEIIQNYEPDKIAAEYEKSGAGAISILTEKTFFEGKTDHISLLNRKTKLPILRKDFIIDEYQIYESKVFLADAILLIASILNDGQIKKFIKIAEEIGLDCIIETHNKEELKRAIDINYPVIGINNRNLDTLTVNTNNTLNLMKDIPSNFIVVGESGIKNYSDIKSYNESGVFNFLIGENILKSNNISLKFKELLNK